MTGTYVAMESFEGSLLGHSGAFNFAHSATTSGGDRTAEFFTVVPGSGTGELTGIVGTGGIDIRTPVVRNARRPGPGGESWWYRIRPPAVAGTVWDIDDGTGQHASSG
ncbi:DUF3224 domain-containing protein [Saccharothrix sp. ST-888]|uniref:DUF3224 domain-containing protein n=1 Tax=Saccharothrix sp. ST-888 TaxID=1427391 RepID=UPI000A843251|nr:DUF3224 domain-containing protein [Saccharothrix sp. ST-888]